VSGGCPRLGTERLILRPFRETDLDSYTEVLQAPEVRRWLHLPDDIGREAAWDQMARWLGQWQLRGTGQWAVELQETGELIGRAGLHHPERADWPGVEVGWTFHPRHWGHGYATEAGRASVDYGFDVLGATELFSLILPENAASQTVARRLGFTLFEERVTSHFPSMPHGIWRLLSADRSA
jgi:RimJ/RimL family protein N-acetyltransferase